VTRARRSLRLWCGEAALRAALARSTRRRSVLERLLAAPAASADGSSPD